MHKKVQPYAPWATEAMSKNNNTPSLEDVSVAAKNYFKTIDQNKKGSGLKPFERWRYHWGFFLTMRVKSSQERICGNHGKKKSNEKHSS